MALSRVHFTLVLIALSIGTVTALLAEPMINQVSVHAVFPELLDTLAGGNPRVDGG